MSKRFGYTVEIFCSGKFFQWFPSDSFSGVLKEITRYEKGVEKMKDLNMSYFIYQEDPNGRWLNSGTKYHLVGRVNSLGSEKPEFFSLAS